VPRSVNGTPTARISKCMTRCAEYDRLYSHVAQILTKLSQLTTQQADLFQSGDFRGFKMLDPEVELTLGEKERSFGALGQHMTEHKCHK